MTDPDRRPAPTAADAPPSLLDAALEQAGVAMAVLEGPSHVYRFANARYRQLVPRDLIGRAVGDVFPELVRQGFHARLDQVFETGEPQVGRAAPVAYEVHGEERHGLFDFVYAPMRGADGTITGVILTVEDVTERERAAEALRASETRYRTFLALSSEGVWRFDTDHPISTALPAAEQVEAFYREGYLAECNAAFARMYGFDAPEDLVGTRLPDLMPQDDPRNVAYLTAFVESGYRLSGVRSYERDRAGDLRVFENTITGEIQDGGLLRAWGTQADVTEQVAAEDILRESEERFRHLADHVPAMIWMTDAHGDVTYLSQTWYKFTGQELRESIEHGWSDAIHPEDRDRAVTSFDRAISRHDPFRIVYRLRRHDGEYRWALDEATPRFADEGTFLGHVGYLADVNDRVEAEEALREFNITLEARVAERTAELERSNRDLQNFAHVASHDLQEPLRKIQMFAGLLREDHAENLDEQGLLYLTRMGDVADRMKRLVQALLEYARVATRAQPYEHVDLNRTLATVRDDVEMRMRDTGGRVDVADTLPTVEADAVQMHQVFLNLVSNALKFHRAGVPPHVRVSAREDRGQVYLNIQDNGIGFDPRYAERIFEPFQRLHGREAFEGSGMGLAIVRRIVERHGGRITTESTPGEGSSFTIVLPAAQTPPAASKEAS